jgi:PKD repeat protein
LTYYFYTIDKWGNHAITETKKVRMTDTQRPILQLNRHGPSFEDLPGSFTFGVTVTDNSVVSNVTIEYWYGSHSKMRVPMDSMGNDYYKKIIHPEGNPQTVYCVINATDVAGNWNNTKKPYSCPGKPYKGFVLEDILFNGSGSFDLDGTISNYQWNFGDGTTGNSSNPTHTYYSDGTYAVTLKVTDNDGKNGTNHTSINVISLDRHKIPLSQLPIINAEYNLTLSEQFFCYDSDGNGIVDTFIDPNEVLTAVHSHPLNLSGKNSFLISTHDDPIPEFFWDTTTDHIIPITHTIGLINSTVINEDLEQAAIQITVDKDQWIYIEVNDQYPNSPVNITTNTRAIPTNMFWRQNGKIYIFDDPESSYTLVFRNIFPELQVTLSPPDGGLIGADNPTIRISFNAPVSITYAAFNSTNIESELTSYDNKSYQYTPPGFLENGTYTLEIDAQALQGTGYLSTIATYIYFKYELPPQQSFLEKNWLFMVIGGFVGAMGGLLIFFRKKHVSVDGFIYLKDRKIIPFFKPVIVGPVSVRIPDQNLAKAEFYIDGQLKDETTAFPALWKWNEKAFMKHTLETRVYDQDGNTVSSGEMEFYIFNISQNRGP